MPKISTDFKPFMKFRKNTVGFYPNPDTKKAAFKCYPFKYGTMEHIKRYISHTGSKSVNTEGHVISRSKAAKKLYRSFFPRNGGINAKTATDMMEKMNQQRMIAINRFVDADFSQIQYMIFKVGKEILTGDNTEASILAEEYNAILEKLKFKSNDMLKCLLKAKKNNDLYPYLRAHFKKSDAKKVDKDDLVVSLTLLADSAKDHETLWGIHGLIRYALDSGKINDVAYNNIRTMAKLRAYGLITSICLQQDKRHLTLKKSCEMITQLENIRNFIEEHRHGHGLFYRIIESKYKTHQELLKECNKIINNIFECNCTDIHAIIEELEELEEHDNDNFNKMLKSLNYISLLLGHSRDLYLNHVTDLSDQFITIFNLLIQNIEANKKTYQDLKDIKENIKKLIENTEALIKMGSQVSDNSFDKIDINRLKVILEDLEKDHQSKLADEKQKEEADTEEADTKEADTEEADTEEADTEEADTEEADTEEANTGEDMLSSNFRASIPIIPTVAMPPKFLVKEKEPLYYVPLPKINNRINKNQSRNIQPQVIVDNPRFLNHEDNYIRHHPNNAREGFAYVPTPNHPNNAREGFAYVPTPNHPNNAREGFGYMLNPNHPSNAREDGTYISNSNHPNNARVGFGYMFNPNHPSNARQEASYMTMPSRNNDFDDSYYSVRPAPKINNYLHKINNQNINSHYDYNGNTNS